MEEVWKLFLEVPAKLSNRGPWKTGDQEPDGHSGRAPEILYGLKAVIAAKGASTKYWVKSLNTHINVIFVFPF